MERSSAGREPQPQPQPQTAPGKAPGKPAPDRAPWGWGWGFGEGAPRSRAVELEMCVGGEGAGTGPRYLGKRAGREGGGQDVGMGVREPQRAAGVAPLLGEGPGCGPRRGGCRSPAGMRRGLGRWRGPWRGRGDPTDGKRGFLETFGAGGSTGEDKAWRRGPVPPFWRWEGDAQPPGPTAAARRCGEMEPALDETSPGPCCHRAPPPHPGTHGAPRCPPRGAVDGCGCCGGGGPRLPTPHSCRARRRVPAPWPGRGRGERCPAGR